MWSVTAGRHQIKGVIEIQGKKTIKYVLITQGISIILAFLSLILLRGTARVPREYQGLIIIAAGLIIFALTLFFSYKWLNHKILDLLLILLPYIGYILAIEHIQNDSSLTDNLIILGFKIMLWIFIFIGVLLGVELKRKKHDKGVKIWGY